MPIHAVKILEILDRCCDAFTFPMLDNGYVYLAATRLSLYRSPEDWALVIEVFGFSPRGGLPDVNLYSFGSRLHARDTRADYKDEAAYQNYLATHPHDESRFIYPVADGEWLDGELLAEDATELLIRGKPHALPPLDGYAAHGITLQEPPRVCVFEVCRYLAATARDQVLATPDEQRVSVLPELTQLLQLDDWHHPNVIDDASRPSNSEAFQMLARVLETGDITHYRPSSPGNTHWSKWPDGGMM